MIPAEAVAAILVTAPEPDPLGCVPQNRPDPIPPDLLDRARRVHEGLGDAGRLTGGPADLGLVHEALLHTGARRAGAHYTPPDVARALVDAALTGVDIDPTTTRIWDPTCGGGVFLLAAADHLHERGADPSRLLTHQLHGTDLDPGATAITVEALRRWGRNHGIDVEPKGIDVADSLLDRTAGPNDGEPLDLVIGNPPFQSQLVGANVRDADQRERLRDRFGPLIAPYTDTAALFLAIAFDRLAPLGRVCLVQPVSVLANRDTTAIRTMLEDAGDLIGLWIATESIFEAAVDVCAPIIERRDHPSAPRSRPPVRILRGRTVSELLPPPPTDPPGPPGSAQAPAATAPVVPEREPGSWSPLALPALGVPHAPHRRHGRIGDHATATAGFRDEYYGLVPHVTEGPDELDPNDAGWPPNLAPLVTVGLIDPGRDLWGLRPIRFAKRRFERPVVDLDTLRPDRTRAAAWVESILVPKVLVATQTRVGESTVDPHGQRVASTPVIVMRAPGRLLELLNAVVCSPIGSVHAISRTAGSGRNVTAIRHTTASVLDLPLPVDHDAWTDGARALTLGDRPRFLAAMAAAYDVPAPDAERLAEWWTAAAPAPITAPTDHCPTRPGIA